jgi:adenosylmethionine-8-amino-7-oxononanoate aminotransferase
MNTLIKRDRAHLWHPYTQEKTAPLPIPIVHGKGIWLYTEDGKKILDGISSWWVNIHGHSHPRLNEAIARQARELEYVMFAGFTHKPAIELAEKLVEILPDGLTRVFYSDNGSTAVEVALKMAFQYWLNRGEAERKTFVTLHNSYHGDTVGAMSASEDSAFTFPFKKLLFDVRRADSAYCYRCSLGLKRETCAIDCLGSLEKILSKESETIAAVLIEPMLQGAGGMIVHPKEFLKGVRTLCDKYKTLLIADEVLTGFGRTARMFACEYACITPDIICLSKALTAGYMPMGATAATEEIYEAFLSDDRKKTFFHGHSYTANPLSCAVAIESLKIFEKEKTLERVHTLEKKFNEQLKPLKNLPNVGNVRVIGGVGIVELESDGGYLANIGQELYLKFLERGLLLRPLGNVLYFMPPYVISEAETDWALSQIEEVLSV